MAQQSSSKVTLKEIAKIAGLSEATVSRVLRGYAARFKIKPETEKAVFDAAKQLGYSHTKKLYKPKAMRSKTLGLIIPDLSHYFLGQMARTIINKARESNLTVLVCDSLEDTRTEIECIDYLLDRDIDGLMILPVGKEWHHIKHLSRQGMPLVVVDRILPEIDCYNVGVDNFQGSFDAVEYLIHHGHQSIACIQRLPLAWINTERVRGYREAFEKYKIPVDDTLILGDVFGQKNGYLEVKKLIQREQKPTAIFCLSHLVTLEVLRALRDHHLKVPDDMSIIGFDDLPNADYYSSPITTVHQPIREMALMAVDLLLEQVDSQSRTTSMSVKLPTTLIRRSSVKILYDIHSPKG